MINKELKIEPAFIGKFFGHTMKWVEGQYKPVAEFDYKIVYALLRYLKQQKLELAIARRMLPMVYQYPKMDFESVLTSIRFKRIPKEELISKIPFLKKKFAEIKLTKKGNPEPDWVMGQLRKQAEGNMELKTLLKEITG